MFSQRLFQSSEGVIKDGEKVIDITPGAVVTVTTGSGVYRGRSLVITAGPWANRLLTHTGLQLPLKVRTYCHLPSFFYAFILSFTHRPTIFVCLSIHPSINYFIYSSLFLSLTYFLFYFNHSPFMHFSCIHELFN